MKTRRFANLIIVLTVLAAPQALPGQVVRVPGAFEMPTPSGWSWSRIEESSVDLVANANRDLKIGFVSDYEPNPPSEIRKVVNVSASYRRLSNGAEVWWGIGIDYPGQSYAHRDLEAYIHSGRETIHVFVVALSPNDDEKALRALFEAASTLHAIGDNTIIHPDLGFQVDVPEKWRFWLKAGQKEITLDDLWFAKSEGRKSPINVLLKPSKDQKSDLSRQMSEEIDSWTRDGISWHSPVRIPLPDGEALWCESSNKQEWVYFGYVRRAGRYFYIQADFESDSDAREPSREERNAFLSILRSVRPADN